MSYILITYEPLYKSKYVVDTLESLIEAISMIYSLSEQFYKNHELSHVWDSIIDSDHIRGILVYTIDNEKLRSKKMIGMQKLPKPICL